MRQFIETLKGWWRNMRTEMRANSEHRKYDRLWHEAGSRIQVREYDGRVWFAFDGMPLLEAEDLTQDFASTLEGARSAWIAWHMGERTEQVEYPTYRDYGASV